MTNETLVADSKSQRTAKKYFEDHVYVQEVAVILEGDIESEVSIHCREMGQRLSVSVPNTHDLEYSAQQLLRRFDVVRKYITYA